MKKKVRTSRMTFGSQKWEKFLPIRLWRNGLARVRDLLPREESLKCEAERCERD